MTELNVLRPTTSLRFRQHALSETSRQVALLESGAALVSFDDALHRAHLDPLTAAKIEVLQVNVGKLCNMTCRHCHVDAGPDRREVMTRDTLEACLRLLDASEIGTLDLTGGAPEMNPHFRRAVETASRLGRHVIDRCNLTVLTLPRYADMADFLATHRVEIVASLPCYLEENVDRQRGDTAFSRSIEALRSLNALGYGRSDSGLTLTLVFNPVGPSLPPDQATLEAAYRDHLRSDYGIEFTRLFTITNMPISRFLEDLLESGRYDDYMRKLVDAFNPAAVAGLMCRNTLSVSWDGKLYDCDFNQMLELPLAAGLPQTIFDVDANSLVGRRIVTGRHCFGCTAGAGSGCQGSIVERT
ncbi:MAG: arsenosugar biosynthesis radical SAM protein ArsS [Planctomycetota bacterium]|nr:arsenosugar biosynthesis radical SAM protein ArsS [Planctomycetaceae bacterium]MDQ3331118.1 arsenosugar biosynthesis radical SAM protein ArsS [Planctomycetota bacterium]